MAKPDRERLLQAIDEMAQDPLTGDIQPLKSHPTAFRRRVGDWRVFFDVDRERRQVEVTDIERRTTTTYRKRK
jgi:mRNA-degrading endonuclease RelE of RelBE toxin-antitoxin system